MNFQVMRSVPVAFGLLVAVGTAQTGPYVETAAMTASAGGDEFAGWSVAVSGDILIAGAPHEGAGGGESGAVYVFERSPTGWVSGNEIAKLTSSASVPQGWFGTSVAIDGDTIVVGEPGSFAGVPGAVYVFEKPAGGWVDATETAALTPSDGAIGDNFGFSVAIDGGTVVSGAPFAAVGGNFSQGAAYVYERPGGGWFSINETAKLTSSNGATSDGFGWAVELDGTTAFVGAHAAEVGPNSNQGAVYVFERPGGSWVSTTENAVLTALAGAPSARLGASLSVDGPTLVAGAPQAPVLGLGGSGPGAVFVFERPGGGWVTGTTETAMLTAEYGRKGDSFGEAVQIQGDKLVVGAWDDGGPSCSQNGLVGEAYMFEKPAGGWVDATETAVFTQSVGLGGRAGESVAVQGDTVFVGSPAFPGAALVYDLPYQPAPPSSPPAITLVRPNTAINCAGETVRLLGTGMSCVTDVLVGGVSSGGIAGQTANRVDFAVPNGLSPGTYDVVAMSPHGASNALDLVLTSDGPAVISALSQFVISNTQAESLFIEVYGSGFECVNSVSVGGTVLPAFHINPGEVRFQLGAGFPIGTHTVVALAPSGPSNSINLTVAASHPSVLTGPNTHVSGLTWSYVTYTDAGWNAIYLLSVVDGTTALPGIVSFEIGGGHFSNLVPVATLTADAGGVIDLPITMPPQPLPTPFGFYWECLTFDPTISLGLQVPLETSNKKFVSTPN